MTMCAGAAAAEHELRICADPHHPPYSREDGSGFENRVAALVARELGATLSYVWLPQGRGYIRKTLNAGLCDVIAGVPSDLDMLRTTAPYYRSSYVFVSRADGSAPYTSFDDPRLARVKVGVQLIGDDLAATPPGHALAARGIRNVVGYTIYAERAQVERMIDDLARGVIDVAVAWGPQAGYFASRQSVPLRVGIASAPREMAQVPFEYSMSMGVRKSDSALQHALDRALARARPEIDRLLDEYAVPRIDTAPTPVADVKR